MALRSIATFVVALCAAGVTAIHADGPEPFAVGIRLRVDPSIAPRRIIDGLKTETEALWEPYGIRIEWTGATPSELGANSVSLDARLERQVENPRRMQWPPVLGRVTVTPDAPNVAPIRVSLDATESVLALRMTSRTALAGIVFDRELSLALGRVLAHEIGHVLLGAHHDRTGLMRAIFRPEELGEPDRAPFRLTCGGLGRLRDRLRAFASDAQPVRDSSTLDIDGSRATMPELSAGASCKPPQRSR